MLIASSYEDARRNAREIVVNGRPYTLSELVGAAPRHGIYVPGNETNDNGLPQGFLVDQPPGSVTPPHFHEENQFQVFVGGSGQLGKTDARPLTVQYANAHTPYGPICAGPDGVRYFTLRQRWDPGAKYMPASRDKLRKGNQRTRVVTGLPMALASERLARTRQRVTVALGPEEDGMAAWLYETPPGAAIGPLPDPNASGGQYVLVTGGSLVLASRVLGELSTVFISGDEESPPFTAGTDGLDMLLLQFPQRARRS